MEIPEWFQITHKERVNEEGSEPPCPFCQKNRVTRSDYIRCNHCGVNWLDEEMELPNYLNLDPRVARREAALTQVGIKSSVGPKVADVEDFTVPSLKYKHEKDR